MIVRLKRLRRNDKTTDHDGEGSTSLGDNLVSGTTLGSKGARLESESIPLVRQLHALLAGGMSRVRAASTYIGNANWGCELGHDVFGGVSGCEELCRRVLHDV